MKAVMFRHGLPIHDDDGNSDACDPSLLAPSVVAKEIGPADPTTVSEVVGEPWNSRTVACVPVGCDGGGKLVEPHSVKGRKCKGDRIKTLPTPDSQPWRTVERVHNQSRASVSRTALGLHKDELNGIELQTILPFLRQLEGARSSGPSLMGREHPAHQREIWTCGQNSYGELGHNDTGTRKNHCLVKTFEGKDVVDIAAGIVAMRSAKLDASCLMSSARQGTVFASVYSPIRSGTVKLDRSLATYRCTYSLAVSRA